MNGFTLLWSRILDSSIWMESKETRIVWITLLAMKDKDGLVKAAKIALAHRARVSVEECDAALAILMAPDPQSMTPANEGRRIEEVAGGWQILNHDLYRFSTEAKREFWKEQKAEQRKKKRTKPPAAAQLPGEAEYLEAERNGASQEELDQIVARHQPRLRESNGESAATIPPVNQQPSEIPELE